jgi:hypothetical protein
LIWINAPMAASIKDADCDSVVEIMSRAFGKGRGSFLP